MGLGGPGILVLKVALLAAAIAAIFIVLNSLRRPASDYAGVPEGRWFYIVPQTLYAAIYVLAQAPLLGTLVSWSGIYAFAAPLVIAQQLAYLLRVAFPTHGRLEARLEAAGVARLACLPKVTDADSTIARS